MKTILHARLEMIRTKSLALLASGAFVVTGCAGTKQQVVQPTPVVTQTVVEPTAEEYQHQAVTALKAGDNAAAKEKLALAVAKDPKLVIAQYDLGFIAQAEGDLDAAARHYEAVLVADPAHAAAILNLGKVYRDQQRYEKGIALYEAAVAREAFKVDYLNNLAVFYRLAGKNDKATETIRKLLSRTKDNPDAYKNLALIAYSQEQYRLAEFIGANAKKLAEKDPGVYNNLGLVHVKLGDRRLALANFRKAVELDPNFAPGLANIGALALSYRDYGTAAGAFEKVVALEPTNASAHLNLAWSYEGMRKPDGLHRTKEAVAEFEKVLALVKDQPDAVYGIARASAGELKDLPRAKEFYERYLKLPDAPLKDKVTRDLASVEQRIKAGAEVERMKREAEEKKRLAEEERRKKARETAPAGDSLLDKVSDDAAKQEQDQGQTPAAGSPEGGAAPNAQPAPAADAGAAQ